MLGMNPAWKEQLFYCHCSAGWNWSSASTDTTQQLLKTPGIHTGAPHSLLERGWFLQNDGSTSSRNGSDDDDGDVLILYNSIQPNIPRH